MDAGREVKTRLKMDGLEGRRAGRRRDTEGVAAVGEAVGIGVAKESAAGLDLDLTERLGAILAAASGRAAAGSVGGNAGNSLAGAVRNVAATAAAGNNSAAGDIMAATPTAVAAMPPAPDVTALGSALGATAAGVRAGKRTREGQGYGEDGEREPRGAGGEGGKGESGERGGAGEKGAGGAEGGEEGEAESAEGGEDGEGSGNKRKMRLSQEQQSTMEAVFRKTPRLTPREKSALAGQLGVRVRQVEVWFQNRRARTKVKDTEVELDGLRRRCQTLADKNRRLRERLAVSCWGLAVYFVVSM
ncbi:unnamed protein product [Closterium sp. Yama58-4]|nr:unnamed protein product [Closterium sp. Yama58-4]